MTTPTPDDVRREIDRDVAFHVDMRARDLIASGVDPVRARQQAEAEAPAAEELARSCARFAQQRDRRQRLASIVTTAFYDLRFALRRMVKRPAAMLAVITMALGIGAAATIYTVVDRVLLRPLPFAEPDRLVSIWLTDERWRDDAVLTSMWDRISIGRVEYDPVARGLPSVAGVGLWQEMSAMVAERGGQVARVSVATVTASVLPLLGVAPAHGRVFKPGEDVLNGPRVVVLSHEFWRQRFGADERAVGRTIEIDDESHEIVGVLPPEVRLNRASAPPALWLPALQRSYDAPENRNRSYQGIARLAPGATVRDATEQVSAAFRSVTSAGVGARVDLLKDGETRDVRASLAMLTGAVGLLLAIACVNVSLVTLADAAARRRELAARAAIGASRARIFSQLTIEAGAQALAAAAIGTVIAAVGVAWLVKVAPAGVPGLSDAAVDLRALGFVAVIMAVVALVAGVAPAWSMSRKTMPLAVANGRTPRSGAARLQRILIGAEVALSFILMVGCGLLGHSLMRLSQVDTGFNTAGVSVVRIAGTKTFWADEARTRRFFAQAEEALATLPGVTRVASASGLPFTNTTSSSPLMIEGEATGRSTQQLRVTPGYFEVSGTPLLAGRFFTDADQAGAPPVVVVSASTARRDFGDASPIGRRVRWQGQWRTIVGVAGDVLFSRLSGRVQPAIYAPAAQSSVGQVIVLRQSLVNRTSPQTNLAAAMRARLEPIDRAAVVQAVDPWSTLVEKSYAQERYRATIVAVFGLLASILAGVGVFAVSTRSIAARQREAGIRVALGASRLDVVRAMTRDLAIAVVLGAVAGGTGAAAAARWLAPQLFAVKAADPVAFGSAALVIALAMVLALVTPLRRALRVNPTISLRAE